MKIKKIIIANVLVLVMLTSICMVSAFEFNEDNQGNPFYEFDAQVKVSSISMRNLFILQPSEEPVKPELGMIYFDENSKRLRLYDGTGWYAIALEKVSSVSKKQVQEKVEQKTEVKACVVSTECGEWGDCINNYQSMTCVTTEENCDKHEDTETRDCISESPFKEEIEKAEEELLEEIEEVEEPIEEIEEEEEIDEVEEPEPEEEIPVEEAIPEELFDITFDLEESVLTQSDKLVVWITLQNFGKRYVPARLIYSVKDKDGQEVYRSFEELRVYTDESIIKRFDDLILEEGNYVLSMNVEYAGIVEEFSDDFSVKKGIFAIIKRFFARLF